MLHGIYVLGVNEIFNQIHYILRENAMIDVNKDGKNF